MGTGVFRKRWHYRPERVRRRRLYITAPTPPGTISLTEPVAYQTFQRDAGGKADIPTTGTYTGIPSTITENFNEGSYGTAVAAPTGGTFATKYPLAAVGSGAVRVRFSNDTSINAVVTPILVGDVWGVGGQSNADGRGDGNRAYTGPNNYASKLNVSDAPALMVDPTGITGSSAGSPWPLLATAIGNAGVPVQFINRGVGGTSITQWLPGGGNYEVLIAALRTVTTAPAGVLFWQGETDAVNGMSAATYYGHLLTLSQAVFEDLGCDLWIYILQNCTDGSAAAGQAAIQSAQNRAILELPRVRKAATLSDLTTNDGFHLTSAVNQGLVASRTFTSLQDAGWYTSAAGGQIQSRVFLGM